MRNSNTPWPTAWRPGPTSWAPSPTCSVQGFRRRPGRLRPLSRLEDLLPVYTALLEKLAAAGASWVQLDEPALVVDQETSAQEIQAVLTQTQATLARERDAARI